MGPMAFFPIQGEPELQRLTRVEPELDLIHKICLPLSNMEKNYSFLENKVK